MKHIYTTVLLLAGICLTLAAQESPLAGVTGIVTDAVTGQPIDLATVFIEGTSKAVETSTNGRYSITVPANEDFTLVFSRIGYQRAQAKVDVASATLSA